MDIDRKKILIFWSCNSYVRLKFLIHGLYDEVVNQKNTASCALRRNRSDHQREIRVKRGCTEMQEIHWLIVRIHPFGKSFEYKSSSFLKGTCWAGTREGVSKPFVHAHHSSAMWVLSWGSCNMKEARLYIAT